MFYRFINGENFHVITNDNKMERKVTDDLTTTKVTRDQAGKYWICFFFNI